MSRLFTSESVTEGHPDKVADAVSDAVLDALELAPEPIATIACYPSSILHGIPPYLTTGFGGRGDTISFLSIALVEFDCTEIPRLHPVLAVGVDAVGFIFGTITFALGFIVPSAMLCPVQSSLAAIRIFNVILLGTARLGVGFGTRNLILL